MPDDPAPGRPFLFVGLLGLGLDTKKAAARRRGKLTGGRWVTDDDGHHLYISGGKVVAGRGVQSASGGMHGAKPKPGGGGGGATTAKPVGAPRPPVKPAAVVKPEPAKPVAKPGPPKPAAVAKPPVEAPKPPAKPQPKPAPKPEPPKPVAEPAKPLGPARDLGEASTKEQNAHHKTMSEDWRKGLSKDETEGVNHYTSNLFDRLNAYNRTGEAGDFSKQTLGKLTKHIDSALNKSSLKEDTTLYRGVHDLRHLGLDTGKSLVGSTFSEKSYSSTSLNRKVAEKFGRGEHGAVLRIRAAKGTKAASVGGISRYEKEHEVLLHRNAKFKVVGESKDAKGRRVLDIEVHHD